MRENELLNKKMPDQLPIFFSDGSHNILNVYKTDIPSAPVFLIAPALGVRAKYYEYLCYLMVDHGWNAITMDWRGSGNSSVKVTNKTNFGYHEIITIDYPAIIDGIRTIFPDNPLYLLGHSLGGQLNLLFASLKGNKFKGLALIAGGSNFYKNLKFPQRYIRFFNYYLIRIVTSLCGYFPGDIFGFAGKESKNIILDWLQESLKGKYAVRNSPNDYEQLLKTLNLPVLFITLHGDHHVTQSCAKYLASKLVRADVHFVELHASDYNLKIKKFNHFNWNKNATPIIKVIADKLNIER